MFDTIRPYTKGSILEIGSGVGELSNLFVQQGIPLYLSDSDEQHCRTLYKEFHGNSMLRGIYQFDVEHPDFERRYGKYFGRFSTVFALNLVQHLPKHKLLNSNASLLLRPGGHLITLLPANTALYNGLDTGMEKWRDSNRNWLRILLTRNFDLIKTCYLNILEPISWWLSRKESASGLYDSTVPCFRLTDSGIFNQLGLSAIVVGRKK